MTYTVLGDSYACGEGVPPFDQGTDHRAVYGAVDQPYTCHRSYKSWARMLERRGGPRLTAQYACSGATIDSLNQRFKAKPAQRVGLRKQSSSAGSSDYVLITVGGNDVGFTTVAATCFIYGRGQQCPAVISAATAKINTGLSTKLFGLLFDIYHSDIRFADIVVVSYPNIIFDAAGTDAGSPGAAADARCPWITQDNRRTLIQLTKALDNGLNIGTAVPGDVYSTHQPEGIPTTQYISTFDLFRGHELCSADPWVNPIDVSPTALADGSWVYSAHPNFAGQRAIADAVASALNTRQHSKPALDHRSHHSV